MIFVGNKADTSVDERRVLKEDVAEWVFCELPKLRTRVTDNILLSSSSSFSSFLLSHSHRFFLSLLLYCLLLPGAVDTTVQSTASIVNVA